MIYLVDTKLRASLSPQDVPVLMHNILKFWRNQISSNWKSWIGDLMVKETSG
ncbi:MAG: hypothetical protein RRA63_06805 [Candidatus Calescibacterium sp.]|nr:hypothetical protein [Candidatus Calescibacterium sp.]